MSVNIDGTDQNFTNLPYSKQLIKSDVNLWHLRTHLTGIIIRGHELLHFLTSCNGHMILI